MPIQLICFYTFGNILPFTHKISQIHLAASVRTPSINQTYNIRSSINFLIPATKYPFCPPAPRTSPRSSSVWEFACSLIEVVWCCIVWRGVGRRELGRVYCDIAARLQEGSLCHPEITTHDVTTVSLEYTSQHTMNLCSPDLFLTM